MVPTEIFPEIVEINLAGELSSHYNRIAYNTLTFAI